MGALFSVLYLFESLVDDHVTLTLASVLRRVTATVLIAVALWRLQDQDFDLGTIPSRESLRRLVASWIVILDPYFGSGNLMETWATFVQTGLIGGISAVVQNITNAEG